MTVLWGIPKNGKQTQNASSQGSVSPLPFQIRGSSTDSLTAIAL